MQNGKLAELTANIGDMALKRRVTKIISELEPKPTDLVLDCGCGDGLYLKTLRELGECRVLGFDLNGTSLRLAKEHVNSMSVPFVQGNSCALPFGDNTFDKIFSTEVLEHIPDDHQALREIHRILKPGGRLIITVPNHNYPLLWDPINWVLEAATGSHIKSGFWAGLWNMHLRLYYPEEIEAVIKKAGLKIISIEALTHYCVPFNHIVLHALKRVLDSGILPEGARNTADKFSVTEKQQSKTIRFGYNVLNILDRLNDRIPKDKSSVSIFVKAVKS